MNKKPEIVRVYLPPDANTLLSTYDHCLRSRHYVNVVVAGKQPQADWLSVRGRRAALRPRAPASGSGPGTTTRSARAPDVVLACAGDMPTLETLAAASILRERLPRPAGPGGQRGRPDAAAARDEHPHGLPDREFDTLFTADRPVIFAFHGYPVADPPARPTAAPTTASMHVRGYKEKGTTTTPFDMVMLNDLDRYHLVMDVVDRVPGLGERAAGLRQDMADARAAARAWTREHGQDIPEVADWRWPYPGAGQ